jgi:hypothetical protein
MTGTHHSDATHAEIIRRLSPLTSLAGTWEGDKDVDIAPAKRAGTKLISGNGCSLILWDLSSMARKWSPLLDCCLAINSGTAVSR